MLTEMGFKEIEIGLYSALAIYLMGKMIDILFEGIYFTKLLLIVSDKNEEIAKEIGDKIKRGTTGLFGKGMYTEEEKIVLMCAASRGDIAKIKMIARKIDPDSFIVITNSREVVWLGFKKTWCIKYDDFYKCNTICGKNDIKKCTKSGKKHMKKYAKSGKNLDYSLSLW